MKKIHSTQALAIEANYTPLTLASISVSSCLYIYYAPEGRGNFFLSPSFARSYRNVYYDYLDEETKLFHLADVWENHFNE